MPEKDARREAAGTGVLDERRIKAQHVSQRALAATMYISQARISTIERGTLARTELGTLQAYVEALGGKLKVVADFGDESIVVRD